MSERHEEYQYLNLLKKIVDEGVEKPDRTGVGNKAICGAHLKFDLSKSFPLLTTRFIAFRIAFEEMMFFLRGETNTSKLEDKKIYIWSGNTSKEFQEKRGLSHLPEKDMGKGYGFQIRNFNGEDDKPGVDQLRYVIENIKNNPYDRRHLMSYWNPQQLDQACLVPCHYSVLFQIANNKINTSFIMRSTDVYHGLPYNIAGYAFLTHFIAKLTGYEPGELNYFGHDAHLYNHQLEVVNQQLTKEPKPFPQFRFKKDFSTLEEALSLTYEDVELVNYEHCGKLKKVEMAV